MLRIVRLSALALAGLFVLSTSVVRAQFASSVVSYVPGTGFSAGFTNPAAALGQPSQVTPGDYGGPVDPFDPAYLTSQLVSIGAGGSLTVKFSTPIYHLPNNRFGIDFMVFGNSGFIITNDYNPDTYAWIGTPATDGSLFGQETGVTHISVSADGKNFYQLDPSLAPTLDFLLPTDGSGNFQVPADPTLTQEDFAGLTLDEIRMLYLGSAGGAGFNIAWARDKAGRPVVFSQISYVRLEVLSGKADIDGFAATLRPHANVAQPKPLHSAGKN